MKNTAFSVLLFAANIVTAPAPILNVVTSDLPKTPTADVRVIAVTFAPGGATHWHTHPTPLFVYVQSGTGIWEFRGGRRSEAHHAGEAVMEPVNVVTRIVNRGTTPLNLVVFQASRPGEQRIRNVP